MHPLTLLWLIINVYYILPTLQLANEEFFSVETYRMKLSESRAKLFTSSTRATSTILKRYESSSLVAMILHFIVRVYSHGV